MKGGRDAGLQKIGRGEGGSELVSHLCIPLLSFT
jgi:hypothetical protein